MSVVLDSSALLAVLQHERGGEEVATVLPDAVISSVNWAEVVQKLGDVPPLGNDLAGAGMRIVPFDAESAEATAALWPRTRSNGLSLADRACLALAAAENIPAMTTDRAWARVDVGVEVRVIR